jgi:hypothetical protein
MPAVTGGFVWVLVLERVAGTKTVRALLLPGLADRCAVRQSLPLMSRSAPGQFERLLREIREARAQLPAEHRNLLAQIGTQEGVVEDWPTGVQDLFRSV